MRDPVYLLVYMRYAGMNDPMNRLWWNFSVGIFMVKFLARVYKKHLNAYIADIPSSRFGFFFYRR